MPGMKRTRSAGAHTLYTKPQQNETHSKLQSGLDLGHDCENYADTEPEGGGEIGGGGSGGDDVCADVIRPSGWRARCLPYVNTFVHTPSTRICHVTPTPTHKPVMLCFLVTFAMKFFVSASEAVVVPVTKQVCECERALTL